MLRAAAHLGDLDVELIVAGTGPLEKSNKGLAEELGVKARFLGRVGEEELPRLYRSVDVYCAPGLGGESFGIVLLEALAAGTPVVASDLAGYRAVASGAARLTPPGQSAALAAELRTVLTDPKIAGEMRKQGSRLASMFDWTRLANGVEAVYERAAKAGGRT